MPHIISFTIDGTSYQAENGMTWEKWLCDEYYNPNGYYFDGHYIVNAEQNRRVILGNSYPTPTDLIIEDAKYTLGIYGGGN